MAQTPTVSGSFPGPRQIQYQDLFFPVLPQINVIVDFGYAAVQGSYEYPLAFIYPQAYQNWLKPSVFYTPTDLAEIGMTRAGMQGSNERHLSFQFGPPNIGNVYKPNVFWTPILDKDRGITASAFQGSNERHMSFRLGPPSWRNVDKQNVFQLLGPDSNRGITAAAFQGSNVRPNPQIWALNYLKEWSFREPLKISGPRFLAIGPLLVRITLRQVQMTFGVSCNYAPDQPFSSVFTPDSAAAATWLADSARVVTWAADPAAAPGWTSDSGVTGTWSPEMPYCKPGQP